MTDVAKPLCFVLMPFGTKKDPTGRPAIDFNRVYEAAIRPAIEDAGLEPIRADREKAGGIIHKPMFERLLLCEYAVADLTTANANVFYELGVRHTARPATTQPIFALHQPIPFDVNYLRALPYDLGEHNAFGDEEAEALRQALGARLRDLRQLAHEGEPRDSPIFDLVGAWRPQIPARMKTDLFREQVRIVQTRQQAMADARARGGDAGVAMLQDLEQTLGSLDIEEASIVVDLMLSYRALKAWDAMVALYDKMPMVLQRQVMVREQLAFALNRRAGASGNREDRARALELLEGVVDEQGPSSETYGLIGRIHKDRWQEARDADAPPATVRGLLKTAIDAYRRGFEADPRDHFPGINTVTLLELLGTPKALREQAALLPVVRFAALKSGQGRDRDYWDHATLLELAVLQRDDEATEELQDQALGAAREIWEPETTARNLRLIRDARVERGEAVDTLEEVLEAFDAHLAHWERRTLG